MANTADIKAVITAEDKASATLANFGNKASSTLDGVQSSTKKTNSEFTNMFKAVVFGNVIFSLATDAARLLRAGLSEANKVADELQASMAQINQLLITTHDASGQSAESINKMAEAISKTTPISKEATLSAVQMLLPFTNITKEVFPGVLKAADDLATHLNHGLAPSSDQVSAAAKQLGRAFNDPATGMALLKRAGISLTQAQTDQIKAMQASGNLLGAQKLLLQDLSNTMGGSAVAAANTFSGRVTMIKNNLVDLAANGIIKIKAALDNLTQVWSQHSAEVDKVIRQVVNFLAPSFKALVDTIENRLTPTLKQLFNALQPGLLEALKVIAQVVGVVVVAAIWVFINAVNVAISVNSFLIRIISNVIGWFGSAAGAAYNLYAVFIAVFRGISGAVNSALGSVVGAVIGGMSRAVSAVWGFAGAFFSAGAGLIHAFASGIASAIGHAVGAVTGVLSKVRSLLPFSDAKEGPLSDLTKSGQKFSETFASGILDSGHLVTKAGASVVGSAVPNTPTGNPSNPSSSPFSPSPAINVTFNGVFTGSEQEFRKLAIKVFQAGADAASMQNLDVSAMTTQHWRRI